MRLLALVLIACAGGDVDADGDGVPAGADCDDADPALGAAGTWYADADGDGWGGDTATVACDAPDRFVADSGDCDDTAEQTHPGAAEWCGDGADNDCVDGDAICERLGGTISVAQAWVTLQGEAPGETCGRAVAAGRDGAWVACTRGAENAGRVAWLPQHVDGGVRAVSEGLVLDGAGFDGQAGRDLAVGDADGDGVEDVLVGAYGVASTALHLGPHDAGGALLDAEGLVVGDAGSEAGRGVLLLDLDQDGVDEVLVGQPTGSGDVAVFWGPLSGEIAVDQADRWLSGAVLDGAAGTALASGGDTDGDGLPDLLVGASRDDTGNTQAGAVSLVLGPPETGSLADAEVTWLGTGSFHGVGFAMASGDFDGDGLSDAVLGAHGDGLVGYYGGAVYVDLGPAPGVHDITTADWTVLPSAGAWFLGISVDVADLDGNGHMDLIIGGHGHRDYAGAAWVIYGPISSGVAVASAHAQLEGLDAEDSAGFAVAAYGDGVLIGAYEAQGTAEETGAAYWMLPQ